jgi:hypothetical protein
MVFLQLELEKKGEFSGIREFYFNNTKRKSSNVKASA